MNRAERRTTIPSRADMQARAQRRRIIAIASVAMTALIVIVAIVLANNRATKVASDAPVNAALKVGQTAPEFTLSTTAGPFDLAAATAAGKPTLLEVFATWCPHCQRETAVLNTLYAKYKGKANLVAVSGSPNSMDEVQPESQADVIDFMTKFNVAYPIAFDPNLDVAHKYLLGGFPTVVLIGKNGKIQSMRSGEIPQNDLAKALDATLTGKTPDPGMGLPVQPAS